MSNKCLEKQEVTWGGDHPLNLCPLMPLPSHLRWADSSLSSKRGFREMQGRMDTCCEPHPLVWSSRVLFPASLYPPSLWFSGPLMQTGPSGPCLLARSLLGVHGTCECELFHSLSPHSLTELRFHRSGGISGLAHPSVSEELSCLPGLIRH